MSHYVRTPSTINMTTDDPVIQEACRQSFHGNGQMVDLLGKKYICVRYMGGGDTFELREIFISRPSKPEVKVWIGEGLPPVGLEVEIDHLGSYQGRGIVLFYGEERCLIRNTSKGLEREQTGAINEYAFRSIRTPEQIAAEERARQIKRIIHDLDVPLAVASRAYDAGYRKFEIVDEPT